MSERDIILILIHTCEREREVFHELADVISQTPDLSNIRIEKGGEKKKPGSSSEVEEEE